MNTDTWRQRRRFMLATVLFCAGIIVYSLMQGSDLRIFETALTMSFTTIITVLASYVFGAAYEDTQNAKVNGHGSNGGN